MVFVILAWVASVVSTLSIALFLNSLGRTMSWYARPLWVFFLYVIPTLVVSMAAILLHAKRYNKVGYKYIQCIIILFNIRYIFRTLGFLHGLYFNYTMMHIKLFGPSYSYSE